MSIKWLAPVVLASSATVQAAEVSSTITFTSDYRFHGISQTAGDPAVQGSLDIGFENGVYAGVWGSNVDFGDDANLEIDWYVGYAGEISDSVSYDATLFYFQYPGYDAADIDFAEIDFNVYIGDVTVSYFYSNDYVNSSEDGQYFALGYSMAVTEKLNLDLHAGYSFGDYWDEFDIGDYADYSVGLSTTVAGVDISLAYLFNDIDSGNKVSSGPFDNDDTVLLTISRTF